MNVNSHIDHCNNYSSCKFITQSSITLAINCFWASNCSWNAQIVNCNNSSSCKFITQSKIPLAFNCSWAPKSFFSHLGLGSHSQLRLYYTSLPRSNKYSVYTCRLRTSLAEASTIGKANRLGYSLGYISTYANIQNTVNSPFLSTLPSELVTGKYSIYIYTLVLKIL